MLVLARKVGEKLIIGNDIAIIVKGIKGDRVTLAIDAPKKVSVLRSELITRARKAKESDNV